HRERILANLLAPDRIHRRWIRLANGLGLHRHADLLSRVARPPQSRSRQSLARRSATVGALRVRGGEADTPAARCAGAVYRAFLELERAAFADGALPKKVKELIAIGISVVINCESCMQWHVEQAA